MDIKTLERLQKLNQLNLTEEETAKILSFFETAAKDAEILDTVNTDNVERMVYVMPMTNIIREDIAKKLSGTKKDFCYYKDKPEKAYRFNYHMDTTISGCPVIAQLSEVFGVKENIDEWLERACEVYTNGAGKNRYEIMNDIWHALFFFDDDEKLKIFAMEKLQLDEAHAIQFSKIRIPSDYASLSLKAIRKIMPYCFI